MIIKKIVSLSIFLAVFSSLGAISFTEQFKRTGYVEICDTKHGAVSFDLLYTYFDELIEFFQTNPVWAQRLYCAKERFIRSKDRNYYSTDVVGFYDESKRASRSQISFYYSIHFHEFICSRYPEFNNIVAFTRFCDACFEIQTSYRDLFDEVTAQLGLETIFPMSHDHPAILLKVITYLPSYIATKPHYDGSMFSIFLDSTDHTSLLLSPYKILLAVDDFTIPFRTFSSLDHQNSIVIIPGTFLTEFDIHPTPHIVIPRGKARYATIAFAMRPNYTAHTNIFSLLPDFQH